MPTPPSLLALAFLTACAPDLSGTWLGSETCTDENIELDTTLELTLTLTDSAENYDLRGLLHTRGELSAGYLNGPVDFEQSMEWDGRMAADTLNQLRFAPNTLTLTGDDASLSIEDLYGDAGFTDLMIDLTLIADITTVDCTLTLERE